MRVRPRPNALMTCGQPAGMGDAVVMGPPLPSYLNGDENRCQWLERANLAESQISPVTGSVRIQDAWVIVKLYLLTHLFYLAPTANLSIPPSSILPASDGGMLFLASKITPHGGGGGGGGGGDAA